MQKRKMDFKNNRSDPHELNIDLFDMEKYFDELEKENKRIEKEYTDWSRSSKELKIWISSSDGERRKILS